MESYAFYLASEFPAIAADLLEREAEGNLGDQEYTEVVAIVRAVEAPDVVTDGWLAELADEGREIVAALHTQRAVIAERV